MVSKCSEMQHNPKQAEFLIFLVLSLSNAPSFLLSEEAPTAAASIVKYFPILKDVVGMFGLIDPWPALKTDKSGT